LQGNPTGAPKMVQTNSYLNEFPKVPMPRGTTGRRQQQRRIHCNLAGEGSSLQRNPQDCNRKSPSATSAIGKKQIYNMMEHWSIVDDYTSAVIFPFHPIPSSHSLSFSEIVIRFSHHFLPTNDFTSFIIFLAAERTTG